MQVKTGYTSQQLREFAGEHLHDNHEPGSPGYCCPSKANWTMELLTPDQLTNVFADAAEARRWFDEEIIMDREDDMNRQWDRLLVEDIVEEVVILIREGKAYIWDGWHRTAAAIIKGVPIKAIVGRPI